ncbi:MAG: hypothetical protein ACRD82_02010, partial [Blastocatellia bacterium]
WSIEQSSFVVQGLAQGIGPQHPSLHICPSRHQESSWHGISQGAGAQQPVSHISPAAQSVSVLHELPWHGSCATDAIEKIAVTTIYSNRSPFLRITSPLFDIWSFISWII